MDEFTFEKAVLNVDAINRALEDSDVFVMFVSRSSLDSSFVSYESGQALESYAQGKLRKLLIVCIDDVSLSDIPEALRRTNIVVRTPSVGACTRRIQALLGSGLI